jgi:hypothetical protein
MFQQILLAWDDSQVALRIILLGDTPHVARLGYSQGTASI